MSYEPRPFFWHENPSADNRLNSLIWADSLMKYLIPRQWKKCFVCFFVLCHYWPFTQLTIISSFSYISSGFWNPRWRVWFSVFCLPYGWSGPNVILLTKQCKCSWPYFHSISISNYYLAIFCHLEISFRIRTVLLQAQKHHPCFWRAHSLKGMTCWNWLGEG